MINTANATATYFFKDLFTADNRLTYEMPCYQRNYSWKWKEYCEILLKDIETLGQQDKTIDDELDGFSYYIGQIILDPVKKGMLAPSKFRVTDGQQRMTTMFLMLKALLAQAHLSTTHREWIEDILFVAGDKNRFSVSVKNVDSKPFEQIMRGEPSKDSRKTLMYKNYSAFCNYFESFSETQLSHFCNNLNRLEITIKRIQDYEDPQLVFAKINSTTKALSDFDLIRNYLLNENDESVEKLCRDFEQIEQLTNPRPELFIKYYTAMKSSKYLAGGNYTVYNAFVCEFPKSENFVISKILDEMLEYAKIFNETFISKTYNKYGINSEFFFGTMGLGGLSPLIMKLVHDVENGKIAGKSAKVIMSALESFYVRTYLVNTSSYGSTHEQFICTAHKRMMEEAKLSNRPVEEEFIKYMKSNLNDGQRLRFPTDKEVESAVANNSIFYNKNTVSKIRHILVGIENSYRPAGETKVDHGIEIDHIMPQNLTDVDKEKHGLSEDVIKNYTHHIGNLTLLASKPNQDKGNKLTGDYYKNSSLYINKYPAEYADNWSEAHIKYRAEELIGRILQVWKYPY